MALPLPLHVLKQRTSYGEYIYYFHKSYAASDLLFTTYIGQYEHDVAKADLGVTWTLQSFFKPRRRHLVVLL
jgi:hypothetical protein